MEATTVYGGGRLWLAAELGAAGCLAPGTGQVADQGRVPVLDFTPWLLAVNASRQLLYAQDGAAIISIRPPRACWS
jgi:streptogramin lyase